MSWYEWAYLAIVFIGCIGGGVVAGVAETGMYNDLLDRQRQNAEFCRRIKSTWKR